MIPAGRLLRTRGRNGEFIAEIYSNQPGRAERLQTVTLVQGEQKLGVNQGERKLAVNQGERKLAVNVENLWYHDGRPIFKFAGIDSISQAEPWEGAEMLVDDGERIAAPEGEYLHSDLIGCTVVAGDRTLGEVKDVIEYGGPVLLQVHDGTREVLIPFVRAFCPEIDIAGKRIVAELPEGLVDL